MIIYLHGLNSAGSSNKARWLREHLAPVPVLAPTYPPHLADAAVSYLRDFIRDARQRYPDDRRLLLVGSSMGGFYAQYLAPELQAGMVLINPALRPDLELMDVVGPNTNEATGESYVLTGRHVRALAAYRVPACNAELPTLVLLDEDDELLDSHATAQAYRGCGKTVMYPGGSHRFDHLAEAEGEIRELYDRL